MLIPAACGDDSGPAQAATGTGGGNSGSSSGDGGFFLEGGPQGTGGTGNGGPGPGSGGFVGEGGMGEPSYIFDKRYGSVSGSSNRIIPKDIAIDGSGNIVVVGSFTFSADFGNGETETTGGDEDAFVAKYDSAGGYLWHVVSGDSQNQNARSVALDAAGNVYVGGSGLSTMSWGGGGTFNSGSGRFNQFRDGYIVKLSGSNGSEMWLRDLGTFTKEPGIAWNDDVNSVAIDSAGNVVAVGSFQAGMSINGAGGDGEITPPDLIAAGGSEDSDVFVAKFTSDGNYLDAKSYGGSELEEAWDVAISPDDGAIAVTGYTEGSIDFGQTLANANGKRGYVAWLSSNLTTHVYSDLFEGSDENEGKQVAFHTNGDLYVAGEFRNDMEFAGKSLGSNTASQEPFVGRVDNATSLVYAAALVGSGLDTVDGLAVDSEGYAVIVGVMNTDLVVHSETTLMSEGIGDLYVAKFGPPGNAFWGLSFGSSGADGARSVAIDASDNVVALGEFRSTVDFGGGDTTAAGTQDMVIVKYSSGND